MLEETLEGRKINKFRSIRAGESSENIADSEVFLRLLNRGRISTI